MKAAAKALVIDERPGVLGSARLRVLVVDHDEIQLNLITSWCETRTDVDVLAYSSAEAALTQSSGDSYDLCLLDYSLDGVNGVMLGAMIRALNPGAKMILMTRSLNPAIKRQAMEHGFQRVIAKPVGTERLAKLLLE
jgi:CheY-like chemotaxis protein